MDHKQVREIGDEIEAAVAEIAKRHGFAVAKGVRGTFDATGCKYTVDIRQIAEDGKVQTQERANFSAYADMFGLQPDDLGKTFTSQGRTYTIEGIAPRRPKYPVVAKRDDGKTFKFPAETVAMRLRR